MTQPAAIPTYYLGIEYRSRLEARWAAFFQQIGWEYTYEPFDGNGYIPDFLIDGPRPLLIEVKPAVTLDDYNAPLAKVATGLRDVWDKDILVLGASPLPGLPNDSWGGRDGGHPIAGVLGEWSPGYGDDFPPGWSWANGHWLLCTNCRSYGVFHDIQSYAGRPCGCYDGDGYLGNVGHLAIRGAWATACNDVKWRGTAA